MTIKLASSSSFSRVDTDILYTYIIFILYTTATRTYERYYYYYYYRYPLHNSCQSLYVCVCEYVIRQPLSGRRPMGRVCRPNARVGYHGCCTHAAPYVVVGYGEGARAVACVVLGVVYLCGAGPVPPWVGPAAAAAVDPRASTPRRRSNCRRTIGRILLDDDDAAARPPPPLPPQRGTVDGRRRPSSTTLRFLINTCIHYTRSDVLQ